MNIVIFIFNIPDKLMLKILVPDIQSKENRFYPVSERLHKFDIVEMRLFSDTQEYIIARDDMQEIIVSFYGALYNNFNGINNALPKNVNPGQLGRYVNIQLYNETWADDNESDQFNNDLNYYRVFAYKGLETWMYSFNNSLYMEFSYSYPQSFDENRIKDDKAEIDKQFEKYIAFYKPLFFTAISREKVYEWLNACEKIIRSIDSGYIIDEIVKKCSDNEQ